MATAELLEALRAEEAELQQKLGGVRRLISLYGERRPSSADLRIEGHTPKSVVTRRGNGSDEILDAVAELLADKSGPTPTVTLLDQLQNRDISVGGSSPRNTLSAKLSYSNRFHALGRSGWVLADRPEAQKDGAAEDEGPAAAPDRDRVNHPVNPNPEGGDIRAD